MDREVNPPDTSAVARNLSRPINPESTSSSSSHSSSPLDFVQSVQAAFKRRRPLEFSVVMKSNSLGARRTLGPQQEVGLTSSVGPVGETKKSRDFVSVSQGCNRVNGSIVQIKKATASVKEAQEDSITPPSISGTITKAFDESLNPCFEQGDGKKTVIDCKDNNQKHQNIDGQKRVQFSVASKAVSQGADDLMATGLENVSSYMSSLALTEMECVTSNQSDASTLINHDTKHQHVQRMEPEVTSRSDCGVSSMLEKRATPVRDHLHHFRNFLSQPNTQSSVVGPSCATTTSVHSTSAPMLNQTTFCSHMHSNSHIAVEPIVDPNVNAQSVTQGKVIAQVNSCIKDSRETSCNQVSVVAQTSTSAVDTQMEVREYSQVDQGSTIKESGVARELSLPDNRPAEGKKLAAEVNSQSQVPLSKNVPSNAKTEASRLDRPDKIASGKGSSIPRKRNYDPDLFFKVNGKLYQRLGKIGSGGSSEVHKVISSDCTIYALKKIKLKGRDYATAYGFCQEIEYLNRLKGKHNIIQLVDYEVTDRALLQEVLNGSMSNKDGRVKDDGYIYMVLEYGEIDLAHMLSQKWKELDGSNQTIDENWLRFYWQQILSAVNTIHTERIVHSDLKPANFLLVKGSLKLIDFGIAKAIMSDTTNIQRDSQVGTLSYMSPEAFMCNEPDSNGNPIKCGRPSDIWSLGCILYQMVYGRTPFADYKTFWAKFKVITDRNHEIVYEPLSNPWLHDIMKKCLSWDATERWRIPELLQHPFLVPPTPARQPSSQDQNCRLLQLISNSCKNNTQASKLCSQLQRVLCDPDSIMASELLTSCDQQRKLLSEMSKLWFQLEQELEHSEKV